MGPRTYIRGNDMLERGINCIMKLASMGPRTYIRGNIIETAVSDLVFRASMGPRTYIRGNGACMSVVTILGNWLQWGRGLTSAETSDVVEIGIAAVLVLQWGRGLTSAETGNVLVAIQGYSSASMGPRTYIRGN